MCESSRRARSAVRRPPRRLGEHRPVRRNVDGEAHWAYVNVIPGVIATGANLAEARANLERAISEGLRKEVRLRRWPLLERIQARARTAGSDQRTPEQINEAIRVARAEGRVRLPRSGSASIQTGGYPLSSGPSTPPIFSPSLGQAS